MNGKAMLQSIAWNIMLEAQGHACNICGRPIDTGIGAINRKTVTIDHVWPKVLLHQLRAYKGEFPTHTGNVALTHHECNLIKGGRKPTVHEIRRLWIINRWLHLPEQFTYVFDRIATPDFTTEETTHAPVPTAKELRSPA